MWLWVTRRSVLILNANSKKSSERIGDQRTAFRCSCDALTLVYSWPPFWLTRRHETLEWKNAIGNRGYRCVADIASAADGPDGPVYIEEVLAVALIPLLAIWAIAWVVSNLEWAWEIAGGSEDQLLSTMMQISQVVARQFNKQE